MVLVCLMILQVHATKGLSNFMGGASQGNSLSCRFGSHKHCGSGDALKEFVSFTIVAMEVEGEDTISVNIAKVGKRIKYFIKSMNLSHSNYN